MVAKSGSQIEIVDRTSGLIATVESVGGKNRFFTETNIGSVNVPFGRDPIPDAHFYILEAGAIGDTIRVTGTEITDTSGSERTLPAFDVTYTLVAGDVDKELVLGANVVSALEADTNFKNSLLEAALVQEDSGRVAVHVTATYRALPGEFGERPTTGDFDVIVTSPGGDTVVQIDTEQRSLKSRAKENSLGRDPFNPHKLGIPEFAGQVRVRAESIEKLFFARAFNATHTNDMAQDGSVIPIVYTINANPAGGNIIIVEKLKFRGIDVNAKVQFGQFMGLTALTNGIKIEVFQNGGSFAFPLIKTTADLLGDWSSSSSDADFYNQSGGDLIVAVKDLISNNVQIELKPGTTDRIEVTIQDNVNVDDLDFLTEGFEE